MGSPLNDLVGRWVAALGIDPKLAPAPDVLHADFGRGEEPCRPGAEPSQSVALG